MGSGLRLDCPSPNLGEVRRGCGGLGNHIQDSVNLVQDLQIGEAEYLKAKTFQIFLTGRILLCLIIVDGAIDFNDQSGLGAAKVDDEALDCHLSAKFDTMNLAFS